MTGKQHLALGFTMGLSVGCMAYQDIPKALTFTGICAIASIFPDIDIKGSIIGKKIGISGAFIRLFLSHRSITHTPLFCGFSAWLVYLLHLHYNIPLLIVNAWVLGYLIHLVQDTFTKNGIKWLFPLYNRAISFAKIKSQSKLGYAFSTGIYIIGMALFICYFKGYI